MIKNDKNSQGMETGLQLIIKYHLIANQHAENFACTVEPQPTVTPRYYQAGLFCPGKF